MSSHYIYLRCSVDGCVSSEMLYTGDIYSAEFDDAGPESWEGETISIRCKECQSAGLTASPSPAIEAQGYLEKTLSNIEDIDSHWTAAEVRELISDALNILAGKVSP